MSTTSASRAEAQSNPAKPRTALVWDAPVRVFHWLMVASFAGAWLTAESERWRLIHVTLGYTMAGLVAFRILWGLVGTRHARFSSFVRGPAAAARYLGAMLRGRAERHTGHNPAGALAIIALLGLAVAVTLSGWATFNGVGGGGTGEAHEIAASLMLGMAVLHVAGVVAGSWMHRENLVAAMLDGRKAARPEDGVRSAWRSVAALMVVAVLGFWSLQWQGAPGNGNADTSVASAPRSHDERSVH
jgi:cytochrome b